MPYWLTSFYQIKSIKNMFIMFNNKYSGTLHSFSLNIFSDNGFFSKIMYIGGHFELNIVVRFKCVRKLFIGSSNKFYDTIIY